MTIPIDQADHSVVVKHRAGSASQVVEVGDLSRRENKFEMQSPVNFDTMAAASRAGREALKQLLDKLHAEHLRWPAA
jgi:hypothetical protein